MIRSQEKFELGDELSEQMAEYVFPYVYISFGLPPKKGGAFMKIN